MFTLSIHAQVVVKHTAYGRKYDNNMNKRIEVFEKAHTEVFLGGRATSGDGKTTYGTDLQIRRQHKLFAYGTQFSLEGNSEVGSLSSAALLGGMKLKNLYIDLLGGYTQMVENIEQKSSTDSAYYQLSAWQPFVGCQARFNIPISNTVNFSVYGGYYRCLAGNSEHDLSTGGNWKTTNQTQNLNRWFIGTGLAFTLNGGHISGDSCLTANIYGGVGNTGIIAGAKAVWFNRIGGSTVGTIYGLGNEYSIKDDVAKNEVYGLYGIRYLPKGAKSLLRYDLYTTMGLAQYDNTIHSSTAETMDDGTPRYQMGSRTLDLGVNGKLHAELTLQLGSTSLSLGGYFGGYVSGKTNYHGDGGYDGTQGVTSDVLYGGVATLGISL
jgi:hypothetical protein